MNEVNNKKYLTVQEVAARLGVKEKTIYSWAHEKRIRPYKFGRLVRFDPDDVDEFIRKSRQEPDNGPKVTA